MLERATFPQPSLHADTTDASFTPTKESHMQNVLADPTLATFHMPAICRGQDVTAQ